MSLQINVRDLPEHGISLMTASDPSFEKRISAVLKGKPDALVDALKPFSVFLMNSSDKAIVAYNLNWKLMKADGTIITRKSGGANSGALMYGGSPGFEHVSTITGHAIRPGSGRFVSLGFSLSEDDSTGISAVITGSEDRGTLARLEKVTKEYTPSAIAKDASAELRQYSNITVVVDGIFFEDGSFIGPDETDFFAYVKAGVDAKYALLREVKTHLDDNRDLLDIFKGLEELAKDQSATVNDASTSTDHYKYFRKVWATELLNMRRALGDKRSITAAIQWLRKPWAVLTRKG